MKKRLVWTIGAMLLVVSGAVAAAQMVVVASTVKGIIPGKMIEATQKIEVPPGAALTLITQAGKTIKLAGPYSGMPGGDKGGGDPKMISSLAKLFKGPGRQSGTLGAMRSVGSTPPSEPWDVDVTRTGTHCFPSDGPVKLWRDKSASKSALTMRNLAGGGRVKAPWPAGKATLAWPEKLALADGASYMIRIKGRATAAKLKMQAVPGGLPSDAHRAAWMAEHGCESQAKRLLGVY